MAACKSTLKVLLLRRVVIQRLKGELTKAVVGSGFKSPSRKSKGGPEARSKTLLSPPLCA